MNRTWHARGARSRAAVPALLVALALIWGCAHSGPSTAPVSEVTGFLGCKRDRGSRGEERVSEACVEYDYDGLGVLYLKHVDGAFNCGAFSVGGDIEFGPGAVIRIDEWEEVPVPADCICLFDIEYRISLLAPGTYRIVISEPYLNDGNEPFDFLLDLREASSGEVCLPRWGYPWNHDSSGEELD